MTFTNKIYQETFNVSPNTALRDLKGLFQSKQVLKEGRGKATKYRASLKLA